jgi:hypothetical protein
MSERDLLTTALQCSLFTYRWLQCIPSKGVFSLSTGGRSSTSSADESGCHQIEHAELASPSDIGKINPIS